MEPGTLLEKENVMSADTATVDFVIEEFVEEIADNPYTGLVDQLIGAGEGKALTLVVPKGTRRDGSAGTGSRDKLLFQQAANTAGHTARVRKEEDVDDENLAVTFTLTKKHARAGVPRKKKSDVNTDVNETDDNEIDADAVNADEDDA
jgi:hypothetical protein